MKNNSGKEYILNISKDENCKYIQATENGVFSLNTDNTTYAFKVMENCNYLEHLYYGRRIHVINGDGITEQHAFAPGNTIVYKS